MSVEIKIDRALDWQRSNATQLNALIASKQTWYDENVTGFISDWFTDVFNLDTANDFGLAVWSVILDEPLYDYYVGSSEDYPAFGFGSAFKNFGRGNFASNTATTVSFSTEEKRQILKLKAYILHMSGNVADINAALANIFGAGIMWAENNLDMSMTYYVAESFDVDFAGELRDRDLLPRPTTVKIDGVNVYYETPFTDFAAAYSETESAVVLTWTEVSDDVTGVTVYRDTSEIDTAALPVVYGTVSAGVETFIDDSFDGETTYYYLIDVQRTAGSFYSENASATTPTLEAWTPDVLSSLVLWLDASDSDTITLDSGVSIWADKAAAGSFDFVQYATTNQPSVASSALNGLDGVDFNGSTDYMASTTRSDLTANSAKTIIALFDGSDPSTGKFSFAMATRAESSGTTGYLFLANENGAKNVTYAHTGNGDYKTTTTSYSSDYPIIGVTTDADAAGAALYADGVELTADIDTLTAATGADSDTYLGRQSTTFAEGPVFAVLAFNEVLSEANRQKVEGYLAHHFGVTDNLPSDHPYKTTAPTV